MQSRFRYSSPDFGIVQTLMPECPQTDFLSRLKCVAAGRDITPWLKGLGISGGTLTRVTKGQTPSTDFLTTLQRAENVRIDWMLSGRGTPYIATIGQSEVDCLLVLEQLLRDEPDWQVRHVSNGHRHAYVLTMPSTWCPREGVEVSTTAIEVIASPGGLRQAFPEIPTFAHHTLDADAFNRLVRGDIGTFELMGDATRPGLLAQPLDDAAEAAAEEKTDYRLHRELHLLIERLPPAHADAIAAVVRALVDTQPVEVLASPHTSLHPSESDSDQASQRN